jgi:hypothetical protein
MVTVAVVNVMQVSVDEVIGVIAVRNCFVPTAGAMLVPCRVSRALMALSTFVRILRRDAQLVLVDVVSVDVVQVPVVQIIDVISVLNTGVAATCAVLVRMVFVDHVSLSHKSS